MPRAKVAPLDKILEIAADLNATPYRSYSGRSMYGRECVGISTNDYADEHDIIAAARRRGIRGERTDSLGRRVIIYWPDIADPFTDEEDAQ